jgi:hypothetical protein
MSTFNIPDGTRVSMSGRELVFGETIFTPREATHLLDDTEALHQCIEEDGYLIIRNFHTRQQIQNARREILENMAAQNLLAPDTPLDKAVIGENRRPRFPDRLVKQWPGFLEIVEGRNTLAFFERFMGGPVLSFDHKWLRVICRSQNAGAHYDVVYMGAGTKNLYTMWTALGDISLDMGPLALCLGSHKIQHLKNTYGAMDAHQDLEGGAFSTDPDDVMKTLGVRWASTPFNAGDVVIFGMYFMHASLENTSNYFRFSSDTRYQLASEAVDDRHMGEDAGDVIPKSPLKDRKSIWELRKEWGLTSKAK